LDVLIAAVVVAHGGLLVTKDKGFRNVGVLKLLVLFL
jgi:predicted nucleic acid-binding protein